MLCVIEYINTFSDQHINFIGNSEVINVAYDQ